jgi:hypothetical protein
VDRKPRRLIALKLDPAIVLLQMTTAEFREIALTLPDAVERSHLSHADFRAGERGRIFATLGYPDNAFGVLILTPDQQAEALRGHPEAFVVVKGAWGRRGSTQVFLPAARRAVIESVMKLAWQNATARKPARKARATPRYNVGLKPNAQVTCK